MSGEPAPSVELVVGTGNKLVRLVAAIGSLDAERVRGPFAVVGGLAVVARLGQAHRATDDVDATYVTTEQGEDLRSVLVATGGPVVGDAVLVDGVAIETIPVGDLEEDALPDDLGLRSFVLAHRWAVDTATVVRIVARGADGAHAEAAVPIASPAALVATKLSAFPMRGRYLRANKQPSDIHDLYRLLVSTDVPTVRRAFADSPFDLASVCVALGRQMLDERQSETLRALRTAAEPITLDDFASALETLFVALD